MNRFRLGLLAVLTMLFLTTDGHSQLLRRGGACVSCRGSAWGSGGCGAVGPDETVAPEQGYKWKSYNGCQYLFKDGVQIAGWDGENYREYNASTDSWGSPTTPPWIRLLEKPKPPKVCKCDKDCKCDKCKCKEKNEHCCPNCPCCPDGQVSDSGDDPFAAGHGRKDKTTFGDPIENFGLMRSKLSKDPTPKYYIGGRKVAKHEFDAYSASVDDDSTAARITVIGPKELRIPVLSMIAATPEANGALVKAYDPTNWAVARVGFKTDGKPTTYVQRSDGGVVARFDTPPTQAMLAAAVVQAKRVPDPNYDPKKDPNGSPAFINNVKQYWPFGLVAGLGLLAMRRKD